MQNLGFSISAKAVAFSALLMLALFSPSFAAPLQWKPARFAVADGHTKLELAVPDVVSFSAMVLKEQNQIVVDLPRLAVVDRGKMIKGKGLVKSYTIKATVEGNLQLVLTTTKPAVISRSTILPAAKGKAATLLLDLMDGADESAQAKPADAIQTATTALTAPATASVPKRIVVLDPGHGGMDPGAVSSDGTREKDVVLAYAQALQETLEATGHFQVVLTRTGDTFMKLDDRVRFAHDHKADLFVAIHADMLNDQSVRGTTVYTVSDKASDAVAEALAQKENSSDVLAGVGVDLGHQKQEVASTLINLLQRESKAQALHFAKLTVNEIKPVTELTSQPMRSAAFAVLKAPDIPSVLIELGYLSNTTDKSMLNSPQWRKQMAGAMTKATIGYFNEDLTASSQ